VKHYRPVLAFILLAGLLLFPGNISITHAQTTLPVVHAVLFYSPTCPHCHYVITETLPPLIEKYGNQLQIIGMDVTQPNGQALFLTTLRKFGLEEAGVPFLVVGDTYFVGSLDIPEKFPGLISAYLVQGGVDWPDIPGLSEELAAAQSTSAPTLAPTISASNPTAQPDSHQPGVFTPSPSLFPTGENPTVPLSNFILDPLGNSLAVIVLVGMVISVIWGVSYFCRSARTSFVAPAWVIPVLCVIGISVAGYLTYVELAQVSAVCGPVGDCNSVQHSEYARLFGILPIGILGLAGYMVIVIAWLINRLAKGRLADLAALSLLVMTALGTLFSIYLTFLEPFIIGATCAWCLTSSVLMTVLMLISVVSGKPASIRLKIL
jgi:uncharacterized membrane protein/thiol-disulfide isomerase/thioredoxin